MSRPRGDDDKLRGLGGGRRGLSRDDSHDRQRPRGFLSGLSEKREDRISFGRRDSRDVHYNPRWRMEALANTERELTVCPARSGSRADGQEGERAGDRRRVQGAFALRLRVGAGAGNDC